MKKSTVIVGALAPFVAAAGMLSARAQNVAATQPGNSVPVASTVALVDAPIPTSAPDKDSSSLIPGVAPVNGSTPAQHPAAHSRVDRLLLAYHWAGIGLCAVGVGRDAGSSYGHLESNPILAGKNGTYDGSSLVKETSIYGGGIGVQETLEHFIGAHHKKASWVPEVRVFFDSYNSAAGIALMRTAHENDKIANANAQLQTLTHK
jgi:hypothetical protein